MKKWGLLFAFSLLILGGCEYEQEIIEDAPLENQRFSGLSGEVKIVTDTETGCKYFRELRNKHKDNEPVGLTVLLNKEGKPDCSGKKTFN